MPYTFGAGVSSAQRNRIVASFCARLGYPGPIGDGGVTGDGSNQDRMRFFQRCIRDFIRHQHRFHEAATASEAASAVAQTDADTATGGVD